MSKFIVTNRKFLNETSNNSDTASVGYNVNLGDFGNGYWLDTDFVIAKDRHIYFYESETEELVVLRDMITEYLEVLDQAKEKKKELENEEQSEVQVDV